MIVARLDTLGILNDHVFADLAILIEDRTNNFVAGTDANWRIAFGQVGLRLFVCIEIVLTHENAVANSDLLSAQAT